MFNINTIKLYLYSFTHECYFCSLFVGFVRPVQHEIKQIQSHSVIVFLYLQIKQPPLHKPFTKFIPPPYKL